jgi:AraC-like DNA-binding protein
MHIYSSATETMCMTRSFVNDATSAGDANEAGHLVTWSHAPSARARRVFNVVLDFGHFRASSGYRVERRRVPGHELLYCVSGSGFVASDKRRFRVKPCDLAWLSGFNAQWADENMPWEVLWMRVEGQQMEHAWAVLSVEERPVFEGLPERETLEVFHHVKDLLTNRSSTVDAALNCRVAELLGYLVQSRDAKERLSKRHILDAYREFRPALELMAADLKRAWRAAELAKLCGLSERHFFRRFKEATGISPINWLRRERISFAQAKLLESGSSIKQIADQVGYNDVFFFSRDFKRHTGSCPSEYRRERSPATNGKSVSYAFAEGS